MQNVAYENCLMEGVGSCAVNFAPLLFVLLLYACQGLILYFLTYRNHFKYCFQVVHFLNMKVFQVGACVVGSSE